MSWPLREITKEELWATEDYWSIAPGTFWRVPIEGYERTLSTEFQGTGRDYIFFVRCPGGGEWCPDMRDSGGSGWTVTGELPNVTVRPSISINGSYHGWLTDGILSDDLEGRTYESPTKEAA